MNAYRLLLLFLFIGDFVKNWISALLYDLFLSYRQVEKFGAKLQTHRKIFYLLDIYCT